MTNDLLQERKDLLNDIANLEESLYPMRSMEELRERYDLLNKIANLEEEVAV